MPSTANIKYGESTTLILFTDVCDFVDSFESALMFMLMMGKCGFFNLNARGKAKRTEMNPHFRVVSLS